MTAICYAAALALEASTTTTATITQLPEGSRVLASSSSCDVEAIADPEHRWWGTQFHPEEFSADHPEGEHVLRNFFELARG
jgi:GMP synthase (glutamine-hydrolysing)